MNSLISQPLSVTDVRLDLVGGEVFARRISTAEPAGNGPQTLVFLHEGLGCIDMWKDAPARLCRMTGLPGLLYDRYGHGRSAAMTGQRRTDYLEREACDVLPQVLESCGVSDPVLIGHSDGGSIALLFASSFPTRAVVAEAAHVLVEDLTTAGIRNAVAEWSDTDLSAWLTRYHGEKTEALFFAWADTWLSEEFSSWNIEPCFPHIACPVLVVQGEDDEYGTTRQVDAIVDGVAGPARPLIVPACGHAPHAEAPDRVLPAIAAFIADCAG